MYQVKQYTDTEWEEKFNAEYESGEMENVEDQINIVWNGKAACMDITANGKRLVPILRKIEKALRAVGLSGDDKEYVFSGWFDSWAETLTNPADRKYFIWSYTGDIDRMNGNWYYSWGIEQIDDDRWYIFLNIATALRVDDHIREKLEEKETETGYDGEWCEIEIGGGEHVAYTMPNGGEMEKIAEREKEIEAAWPDENTTETLTNIHGDIAVIYYWDDSFEFDACRGYEIFLDGDREKGQGLVTCGNADTAYAILSRKGFRY